MSPEDRRPHRGGFERDRGRPDRPAGPFAADRDRPGFGAPRPFNRPPTRGGDMAAPEHSVRLRDGDREVEVSGNPAFVRQVLDDLPVLLGRLRGDAPARSAISMPPPPVAASEVSEQAAPASPAQNGHSDHSLEEQVFQVLRGSRAPLSIAAIRKQLDGSPSGQQVRRLLERAGDQVKVSSDRPATYSIR